jgi:hypothetical protein
MVYLKDFSCDYVETVIALSQISFHEKPTYKTLFLAHVPYFDTLERIST